MLHLKWSLRQQMVSPLMLAGILFLFWFADRVTTGRQGGMDATEDKMVLAITDELAQVSPEQIAAHFEDLRTQYPGWEFAALEGERLVRSTVPISERDREVIAALPARFSDRPGRDYRMTIEGVMYAPRAWYWMSKLQGHGKLAGFDIVLLYSAKYAEALDKLMDRQDEMIAGGLTVALIMIAVWYSGRLGRRITDIQRQVRLIADGQTSEAVDERGHDEISDLARSVNVMASDLDLMKRRVEQSERARLHAQVGRGIAHELRNGIHSARLALEMFREEREEFATASLLSTSYDQLCVTELQVRRLLAVGQPQNRELNPRLIRTVLEDAVQLVDPMFRHAGVKFTTQIAEDLEPMISEDSESMQSAIVNLCVNALEAAGRHGETQLAASSHHDEILIQVSDTGPGPAASVAHTIFEPFVTTKPEGVGLGLVLVRQAVKDAGGTVGWDRINGRTVFWIKLPGGNLADSLPAGDQQARL